MHAAIPDLVSSIYRASFDARLWQEVLSQSMRMVTDAAGATCLVPRAGAGRYVGVYQEVGGPPGFKEAYSAHFHKVDVVAQRLLKKIDHGAGVYGRSDEIIPRDELERSEIYKDLIEPHRLVDFTTVAVGTTPQDMFVITIFGPRWSEAAARGNEVFLRKIQPHLTSSITLFARLEVAESAQTFRRGALEEFRTGVVWLDRHGCITSMNDAAERLVDRGDGIRRVDGRLAGCRPVDTAVIDAAVGGVIAAQAHGPTVLVQRPSGLRSFALTVVPTDHPAAGYAGRTAAAVVFITESEATPGFAGADGRARFGLTREEVAVAAAMAQRVPQDMIARRLGMSQADVATHADSVAAKTGGLSLS